MFPSRQNGRTPLHSAAAKGSAETAAALLGAKAEVDAKDQVGARERERDRQIERKGRRGWRKEPRAWRWPNQLPAREPHRLVGSTMTKGSEGSSQSAEAATEELTVTG